MDCRPKSHAAGVIQARPGDSCYPACLATIPDPPEVLYLRGRIPPPPRVALVGSRDADAYGLEVARMLGASLAAAGVCVVSGGAGGVDSAALEGCLEGSGLPIAVLGTGVDVAYPASNRELFERIAAAGVLLSEYAPGTPGHPGHFPRRNRIVSGLADAVVVVRAAEKSGSLITAHEAVRQGRMLMAVPGPAGNRLSAGVHQLIRRGARLVESTNDILHELKLVPAGRQPRLDLAARPVELPAQEKRVWESLSAEACAIDSLISTTGLPSQEVAALLLNLELKGLVLKLPGMLYRRSAAVEVNTQE